jgi:hypothetical protein
VELPPAALDWLRAAGTEPVPDDRSARTGWALTLGLVAVHVPAWIEPVGAALDRLGDDHDAAWVRAAVTGRPVVGTVPSVPGVPGVPAALTAALGGAEGLARLARDGVTPVPQVVGLPLAQAGLRRAEWIDGNLYLHLVPVTSDRGRRLAVRLVGAEPRQWDIAGIPGVLADLSSQGLQLLIPMVEGPLELSRGSY